jgi:uncharacterized membrane protein YgcG
LRDALADPFGAGTWSWAAEAVQRWLRVSFRTLSLLLFSLFLLLIASPARALDVPPLEGRVNDRAGIIPDPARQRIEQRLLAYEQSSGHQFAVLTLTTLEGDALEDFSIRVVER